MRTVGVVLIAALSLPVAPAAAPRETIPRGLPAEPATVPAHVQRVAPAVVGIKAQIPLDRPSVLTLGPLRSGCGVIFDPAGYVLTVGYIVMDATTILVSLQDKRTVPARVAGMDLEHGLAVLKLEGDGPWPAAPLGDSASLAVGDATATVGVDDENDLAATQGKIEEIKSFAGYWEYLLERAIIVAPVNPAFGGSPLINTKGEVIGVTSLQLGEPPRVNLAIPIEYFTPGKQDLMQRGRVQNRPPRPWIGVYTVPADDGLVVAGGSPVGPAAQAGFQRGDVILRLNGERVEGQEDFYRKLWKTKPGEEVAVVVLRDSRLEVIKLRPVDRYDLLRRDGR
jgi:S1-C subfamily serine protease